MNSTAGNVGPWKVGELANLTGVTVRALHHYEEIGLLSPGDRSESGHRLYGLAELKRLQQIVTLAHLGFSLPRIRDAIHNREFSLRQELHSLHQELRARRCEVESMEERLSRIERLLGHDDHNSTTALIEIIGRISMFEKYFTAEQLDRVKEIEGRFTPERVEAIRRHEFPELIAKIKEEMARETPPTDRNLQDLARQWMKLVNEKSGGDPELARGYRAALENEPSFAKQVSADLGHPEVDFVEMMNYVGTALEAARGGF
ncbi:MAG: MerR family transcriptional regulator [Deltaproteobacteria bacterium]|nr:MerR family transcriptional regulator [Deltaproteobacteria bacterium]